MRVKKFFTNTCTLKLRDRLKFIIITFLMIDYCSCNQNPVSPENGKQFDWPVTTPSAVYLDSLQLNTALDEAGKRGFINSVLVIRYGKIASERYYNGYDASKSQTIMSVTKSFMSAMIGIAVRDSMLRLDQKAIDFFPEYSKSQSDRRFSKITVKDLLEMQSGIDNDYNIYDIVVGSNNWIKTIISLPLVSDPGTEFQYSTSAVHLLSGILTKASGMSSLDFANKFLFGPMEISSDGWRRDPQGIYSGGSDLFLTPRNMAALGLLYMNNGKLDGKQIVPENWIKNSITNHKINAGESWGDLTDEGYGYLWWLGKIKKFSIYTALGWGGQYVLCFPSLSLIIVTTANPYHLDWNEADAYERSVLNIVANFILPAVKNN